MKQRIMIALLVGLTVSGVALAQFDPFAELGKKLTEISDRRDPDRLVARGFDAVFDTRESVSRMLRLLVLDETGSPEEILNTALDSVRVALDTFVELNKSDSIARDQFGTVVLERDGEEILLDDFDETLDFFIEELGALQYTLTAIQDGGATEGRFARAIKQSQHLETYIANYFDIVVSSEKR